ncbi:MAG TPA: hypothetical protein EYO61_03055, partial [Campylobacterales bacterium]|nr:hypothetical protein [Campylobacterales bacterium]
SENRIDEHFDPKRIESINLTLYRYLTYTKEGDDLISIDVRVRQIGDTLTGDEVVKDRKFFNVLRQKSTGKLNSIEWEEVDKKKIEDAKLYIVKNYPHQAKKVSEIEKTKYLYLDEHGNIYFPIFLRKFVEAQGNENQEIRNYRTLEPQRRHTIVAQKYREKITPLLKEYNIELQPIQNFAKLHTTQFLVGGGNVVTKSGYYDLVNAVRRYGLYKIREIYNLVVVNTIPNYNISHFVNMLSGKFREFRLNCNIQTTNFVNWERNNEYEIEKRIGNKFLKYVNEQYNFSEFMPIIIHPKDNSLIYRATKRILIEKGIPSQFVSFETINSNLANSIYNILFGIVAKFGDEPFVLYRGNEDIDYFIGYDVSREKREKKVRNFSGSTYFFSKHGEFEEVIRFYPEGEKIRGEELRKLLPPEKLENKTIVIHRDGRGLSEEIEELKEYSKTWNIKLHLVYIAKRPTVRIFKKEKTIKNPEKGIYLQYMENRAILVTSDSKIGTKQPLKVEYIPINTKPMSFETILQDILNLTYLNYSSVSDIKLPITTYYSHQISNLIRQGIEPSQSVLDKPYWI